ncbi:hypothetical protein [Streptomyces sp.]|uniref:hypothetical protein n=1 Tax=Streptomyces sp. TaxID=1931 RepID=UPI002F948941
MPRRWRPPHPPRTIHPPRPCPTGRPRFGSEAHARAALLHGMGVTGWTVTACGLCDGFHHQPADTARAR